MTTKKETYPVLPLRDLVMFPKMIVPLFVGRPRSIQALENTDPNKQILLIAQKDPSKDNPKINDVYKIGVVAKVLQMIRLQDSTVKILVEGIERVKVLKFFNDEYMTAEVEPLPDTEDKNQKDTMALYRSVSEQFEEYTKMNKRINSEIIFNILQIKDLEVFCNTVSAHILVGVPIKQEILEITTIEKKLEKILLVINQEVELMNAENRIKVRVRNQIEENQKHYYLNEQLKAIHKELGEEDFKEELTQLEAKAKKLKLSNEAKDKLAVEIKRLGMMNSMSSEANVIRNYIDWIMDIPWNKFSKIKKDLKAAQNTLDKDHYGLEKIKERVIEYLAVNLRTNHLNGPIICLVGPPGVGKTSLAKSIASATGRHFIKISLGGVRDEAEIKGHRRTYIGAMPGKIIQAMKKAKTSNPLILLDEIDKMSQDFRGDPASALLDVLDPEQNKSFNDHFIEVDYDLSGVMFLATANSLDMPRPLLDRMEIIRLSGYTDEEKLHIAKQYLIPKQSKVHALKASELSIQDDAIMNVINQYTKEAGVRSLERAFAKMMRKTVYKILQDKDIKSIDINSSNLKDFLGVHKFDASQIETDNKIGITNGLAYTEVGGDLLALEAVKMHGKGEVKITGTLGDVMKESVQAALSYIRSRSSEFGIKPDAFKDIDIHLHVPEGATPKDGPSAGVGIATSIVSVLTSIPVKRSVAMTGEITLRGRVLAIGGLKEKMLAALRGGVTTVLIPKENIKDLEDIPDNIKNGLEIIPVESVNEVFKVALTDAFKPIEDDGTASVQKSLVKKIGSNSKSKARLEH